MTCRKAKNAGAPSDVCKRNREAQPLGLFQHCAELGELRLGDLRIRLVR